MPDFKKYFIINATPEEVFTALTFKPTIELWTGSPAIFTLEPDAEFSLWDGSIVGKVLDFEKGKWMRQEWFFGDSHIASIVLLKFHEHKSGTSLEVKHTDIPMVDFDEIVDGWENVFMKDLIDFYED